MSVGCGPISVMIASMSRDTPAARDERRTGRHGRRVVCIGLVWLLWPASAYALFSGPNVTLVDRPADLRPGDGARVVATVSQVGVCRLALSLNGSPVAQSSLVTVDGSSRISWAWQVPARPGAAAWQGTVECWKDGAAVAIRSADARLSFAGTLRGRRADRPALVDRRGLTVAGIRRVAGRSLIQRVGDYSVPLGSLLTTVSLVLIWLGVRSQRRQSRAERLTRLAERSTEAEFAAVWSTIMGFLTAADERAAVAVIRAWERPTTSNDNLLVPPSAELEDGQPPSRLTRNDVLAAMNFHEQRAGLFNLRELDDRHVMRSFGALVAQAFDVSWWWIHYRRGGARVAAHPLVTRARETESFAEWERMVRTMVRLRPGLTEIALNAPGRNDCVRALCLPPADSGSDAVWAEHAALSKALGDLLRHSDDVGLDALTRELEQRVGKVAASDKCPTRTLVVPRWRRHAAPLGRLRRAVAGRAVRASRRSGLGLLGRLAPTDPRVAYHVRFQDVAILLDRLLQRPGGLTEAQGLIAGVREDAGHGAATEYRASAGDAKLS
jgi:hypothetical protein